MAVGQGVGAVAELIGGRIDGPVPGAHGGGLGAEFLGGFIAGDADRRGDGPEAVNGIEKEGAKFDELEFFGGELGFEVGHG